MAFSPSDEMVYDDVENGEEGGNSSVECGWSSSEFESYEEQSDSECKNGVPRSFLRSSHRKQVCAGAVRGQHEGTFAAATCRCFRRGPLSVRKVQAGAKGPRLASRA